MSGKIYYGMHFYPGLAQYDLPNGESHKILLTEETLRKMDKTFQGKPGFVEHVDEVEKNRNKLRNEADLWVFESFYNEPDGKHWTKFITVTDEADRAISNGYRLSNAYDPQLNGRAGVWNGIPYDNEVVDGEYEHLAIVKNPRYDESIIMTPEEFKKYNEDLKKELSRIANSKEKENKGMALKFWNRKPVENSLNLEETFVSLPKSKKEFSLLQIVNAMDEMEEKKKENEASPDMKVKMHDGTMCNVADLVEKYKELHEKHENMSKNMTKQNEEMSTVTDLEPEPASVDVEGDLHNAEDDEDEDDKKKKEEEMKKKKLENSLKRKQNFESLKNAPAEADAQQNIQNQINNYESSDDKIARGKSRYGS